VPSAEKFESLIFNDRFGQFVRDVKEVPREQRHLRIPWTPGSIIQITYVPGRKFVWCTGYTSYTVPTQRDRNPLYLALKDKGGQLKRCGFSGTKGVIICDGGAHVLRNTGGSFTYSTRDIVLHALKRHTSIDFVAILSLQGKNLQTIRQDVRYELFIRDMADWALPLDQVIAKMVEQLPEVVQSPDNARSELAYWLEPVINFPQAADCKALAGQRRVRLNRCNWLILLNFPPS